MKRWSKLKKEITKLFDERLSLDLHCAKYRMQSQHGSTDIPRYWLTLNKEIVWDYPKDFKAILPPEFPYLNDMSEISELIREYIDTPETELITKSFNDPWKLTEILKAADRRIGRRRFDELKKKISNENALRIVSLR
jgi:hypothetical protein